MHRDHTTFKPFAAEPTPTPTATQWADMLTAHLPRGQAVLLTAWHVADRARRDITDRVAHLLQAAGHTGTPHVRVEFITAACVDGIAVTGHRYHVTVGHVTERGESGDGRSDDDAVELLVDALLLALHLPTESDLDAAA